MTPLPIPAEGSKPRPAAQASPAGGARRAGPCAFVIFGASGDLTRRKLLPALYNLSRQGLLPDDFAIVGLAKPDMTDESFRDQIQEDLKDLAKEGDSGQLKALVERAYYLAGDFDDIQSFRRLGSLLEDVERRHKTGGNCLFYLATAPRFFAPIVERAGETGLLRESENVWKRVVIEKPFGRDLESAAALNAHIRNILKESQVYRIDHYLGKETVQNILVFRFANGIFEHIWNRHYIDHVQITVAEDLGVGTRGGYYDGAGALRDMVPNHLFQLLTLTAMETPVSFEADTVRNEQVKVIHAVKAITPEQSLDCAVRGQYAAGEIAGVRVPGYRSEPMVSPSSRTETFAALQLQVDNWRWADVPFFMRTGKRLPRRASEIVVEFKRVPHVLFSGTPVERLTPNQLVIRIQPDEGIALSFEAKIPGPTVRLGTVNMDFHYHDYFGEKPSTGYERLLYDCMLGDATLFQRSDMLEACWRVVAPVLDVWEAVPPRDFPNYASGTWGPQAAEDLIKKCARAWREPVRDHRSDKESP